jgi:hypothetical protein
MADISAIILCEGVVPPDNLTQRLEEEGISLITTPLSVFDCCKQIISFENN